MTTVQDVGEGCHRQQDSGTERDDEQPLDLAHPPLEAFQVCFEDVPKR